MSGYRSLLRSHQDINPDSPMSIALVFYYDQLAELAAQRPKKDEAAEALRRLNEKMVEGASRLRVGTMRTSL